MAIYGYDYYGPGTKYGSGVLTDFGVAPFTAEPVSRTQIRLLWNEPSGNWTGFRLLRSRAGYAVNEVDGSLLYSLSTFTPTAGGFTDTVAQSGWYYYTIYLYDATQSIWVRSAVTSCLSVEDYDHQNLLWSHTPEYYKSIRDDSAGYSPISYGINPAIYLENTNDADNLMLRGMYDVFGFGFDLLRSQAETTMWGSDANKMHFDRLALRAAEMGAEIARSVPAQNNRNLVQNLGLLYRERGTVEGLRNLLALSTGWNIDVSVGPNLMLNEDQANFVNPKVADWDYSVRYVTGDYVKFNSRYFVANVTAYGTAQTPPATGNNTYWNQVVTVVEDTTITRTDTANIGTWQAYGSTTGPLTAVTATHIGKGVPHPTDGAILATNALGAKNTAGSTQDLTVINVPMPVGNVAYDREYTTKSAVPVPAANLLYDAAHTYVLGDLVYYNGIVWKAIGTTVGNLPTNATYWKKMGYDRRVRLMSSMYAHGPFSGSGGTGGLVVKPVVVAYSDTGQYLWDVPIDNTQITDVNFDSFNTGGALAARTLELGGKAWAVGTGVPALAVSTSQGGYMTAGAALATATVPIAQANINLGITYLSVGSRNVGLMLRYVDVNNHFRAEQGRLVRVQAAAVTSLATYTPFVAGDRMTVTLNGSSIIVKKNGTQVASVTDAFQSATTTHGIIFE